LLIVSTDYWKTPVDTTGKLAFGQPIHVFTGAEMNSAVQVAREFGLELTSPLDLDCAQRAVRWDDYGLQYTFIVLTLRRAEKVRSPELVSTQDHTELLNVATRS
jgi:hypothetical protein